VGGVEKGVKIIIPPRLLERGGGGRGRGGGGLKGLLETNSFLYYGWNEGACPHWGKGKKKKEDSQKQPR